MKPGEYQLDESAGAIAANVGRRTAKLLVRNTGDRPIQVGSHFHFFETNRFLNSIAGWLMECGSILLRERRFVLSRAKPNKWNS